MSELPLFPLNTVLFPGGDLALRIFEARYVDLVGRCMRAGEPFGVVLIQEGAEVGPVSGLAEVGTTARIIDFDNLPDGLLGIACRGEHRFRIRERSRRPDGLHVAQVDYLPEPEAVEVPEQRRALARLLAQVEARVAAAGRSGGATPAPAEERDAGRLAWRLGDLLPLPPPLRQRILETDPPVERLELIAPLVRVAAD